MQIRALPEIELKEKKNVGSSVGASQKQDFNNKIIYKLYVFLNWIDFFSHKKTFEFTLAPGSTF